MTSVTVLAEEGPVTIGFDDLVRYHGHAALSMLAVTFRAQEAVFRRLLRDTPPPRAAISDGSSRLRSVGLLASARGALEWPNLPAGVVEAAWLAPSGTTPAVSVEQRTGLRGIHGAPHQTGASRR